MKKLFAFISLFAFLLCLAGCAASVSGKTYKYDSFEYELSEDLTAVEKGIAEVAVTGVKKIYENIEITFNEDGTTSLGFKYTQDGSKLVVGDTEYKVKGSKIVLEVVEDDYSITITLAEKK
jgi:hypothetical protein